MSLYEIKELMKSMLEMFCMAFAMIFAGSCALLLAFHLFGVVVGR